MSRPRAGFTLVELMIAVAILAIALASFSACLWTTQMSQRRTESQDAALQKIQQIIEDIQNANFGTYAQTYFDVAGLVPPIGSKHVGSINPAVDSSLGTIIYTIDVSWRDQFSGDGATAAAAAGHQPNEMIFTYVHANRGR